MVSIQFFLLVIKKGGMSQLTQSQFKTGENMKEQKRTG